MNAPVPLEIATPDGSGQTVHPDVAYCPDGFLGYKYWMACTPYPFAADRLENPVVRVSNDGLSWRLLEGCPDPLVEAPADPQGHHADTDIAIHGGTIHVVFITTRREAPETTFSVVTSTDGRNWSRPQVILEEAWAVSPSLVVDPDGRWHLWHVVHDGLPSPRRTMIRYGSGTSPDNITMTDVCALEVPGHVIWHIDVIRTANGFEALVAAFRRGADPSRCRLFHADSGDGRRFVLSSRKALVRPTMFGWDNRMIYRSTFVKHPDGNYQVWYSAASWGMRCGIGLLEGKVGSLRPTAPLQGGPRSPWHLPEDAIGLLKYLLSRCLPPEMYRRLALVRAGMKTGSAGPA